MNRWRLPRPQWHHLALVLYLLSLILPAVHSEEHNWLREEYSHTISSGFIASIIGMPVMLFGYFAWLANPLFLAAYRARSGRRRLIYALLALLAGLSVQWQLVSVYDEDGKFTVTEYTYGYYLWLLSFVWLGLCGARRSGAR
ncbi:hypothetical protein [Pseudomonas sp. 2835]|uniref:hypothetical protein n=1 Tax=Pseudomonas sp. 2835 TaxID=3156451 RepID=UPI003D25BB7E